MAMALRFLTLLLAFVLSHDVVTSQGRELSVPNPPLTQSEQESAWLHEQERLQRVLGLYLKRFQDIVAKFPDAEVQLGLLPFMERADIGLAVWNGINQPFLFIPHHNLLIMYDDLGRWEELDVFLGLAVAWVEMNDFAVGVLWDGTVPTSVEGKKESANKIWGNASRKLLLAWNILRTLQIEDEARPAELRELLSSGKYGEATFLFLQATAPRYFASREDYNAMEAYWKEWARGPVFTAPY